MKDIGREASKVIVQPEYIEESLAIIQRTFREYRDQQLALTGNISHSDKHDGSPVTELDIEIEKSVQRNLRRLSPHIPVYGEESGYSYISAPLFWLIDPIDGTKSFINGTPTFSNMAALIANGQTVASVIYNPTRDDMYVAEKGKGAFKNGSALQMKAPESSFVMLCKESLVHDLDNILSDPDIELKTPPSGGGHGFLMVAEGDVCARFQLQAAGSVHDYAPGALLVEEAGGVIIPIATNVYTFASKSFIACHKQAEHTLKAHINEIRRLEHPAHT